MGSFGEDDKGNLYVIRLGTLSQNSILRDTGEVFRIPEPGTAALGWGGLGTLAALVARRRKRLRAQRGANAMGNLL